MYLQLGGNEPHDPMKGVGSEDEDHIHPDGCRSASIGM